MTEQTVPASEENPSPDAGQTEQPTGSLVMERIRQLEDAQKAADERARRAEETNLKLQADRDRTKAQLDRLKERQAKEALGKNTPIEELRTFANEKARENLVLHELIKHGLVVEDLGLEIDELTSPAEVKAAIKLAALEKKIAAQDQQPTEEVDAEAEAAKAKAEVATQPASPPPVDTGGPSSPAPATSESDNSPEALRAKAQELKKLGTPEALQEARWLVLNASYADPKKVIGRGRGGETVEG